MSVVSAVYEPQTEELRELYERLDAASGGLGVLNIFRVLAHSPRLLRAWLRMATLLLTGLDLSPRLRELAILRVFQNSGGEYGFAHHVRYGREVGLTLDEIASLQDFEDSERFSDLDRRVIRYADAASNLTADAPELGRELKRSLSERELVELTFCIGHWNMLARILQPLEVEADETLVAELPDGWREWL
jgi:alkylhydroperoxidase family enzyme